MSLHTGGPAWGSGDKGSKCPVRRTIRSRTPGWVNCGQPQGGPSAPADTKPDADLPLPTGRSAKSACTPNGTGNGGNLKHKVPGASDSLPAPPGCQPQSGGQAAGDLSHAAASSELPRTSRELTRRRRRLRPCRPQAPREAARPYPNALETSQADPNGIQSESGALGSQRKGGRSRIEQKRW